MFVQQVSTPKRQNMSTVCTLQTCVVGLITRFIYLHSVASLLAIPAKANPD